jgi:hypothetical protein
VLRFLLAVSIGYIDFNPVTRARPGTEQLYLWSFFTLAAILSGRPGKSGERANRARLRELDERLRKLDESLVSFATPLEVRANSLTLPREKDLDRILRYEMTNERPAQPRPRPAGAPAAAAQG